jgi:hypothetical protein
MTSETFDRLLADGDETTAGNYFVANYPPFSFWQKDDEHKAKVLDILQRPLRRRRHSGFTSTSHSAGSVATSATSASTPTRMRRRSKPTSISE